jgi:hypothetical protein
MIVAVVPATKRVYAVRFSNSPTSVPDACRFPASIGSFFSVEPRRWCRSTFRPLSWLKSNESASNDEPPTVTTRPDQWKSSVSAGAVAAASVCAVDSSCASRPSVISRKSLTGCDSPHEATFDPMYEYGCTVPDTSGVPICTVSAFPNRSPGVAVCFFPVPSAVVAIPRARA